ncbi:MAG: C4-type zinc ribbon domain-containing protein [Anaerolineales bacterium]
MSASFGLYRLQLLDSRLDEIHARMEAIRCALENDTFLRAAKDHLAEAEAKHKAAIHTLKQAEAEAEKVRDKIRQGEISLYSGNVKNPKELQDLQNESAALKRHLVTLEERQLEAMLAEETAAQVWEAARENLSQVEMNLAGQVQALSQERAELEKELERLTSERRAALLPLDAPSVSDYETLRQQRKGLAVVALNEGACAACGTTLTPSQQQSARSSSQLYHCPTCGRILYAH